MDDMPAVDAVIRWMTTEPFSTYDEGVRLVKRYRRRATVFGVGMFVASSILFQVNVLLAIPVTLALAFGLITYLFKYNSAQEAVKETFASPVVERIVGEVFDEAEYSPDAMRMRGAIREHNVGIPSGHMESISTTDMVEGFYRGMPVCFCDCRVTYTTRDSDGDETTHTAFEGSVVMTQHKVALEHPVRVLRTRDRKGKRPMSGWRGHDVVLLDDSNFEAEFAVFSDDAESAYYVLTPKMMEDVMRLAYRVDALCGKTANVMLLFEPGGTVFLALGHGCDMFEVDAKHDLNEALLESKFREQMGVIIEMLDGIHAFGGDRSL